MRELPDYVNRALRQRGESWPHVLSESLRGGMPFQRLPLPSEMRRQDERNVWALIAIGTVIYALVAWRLG